MNKLLIALFLGLAAAHAGAELLWDDVYDVPAVYAGNGRWLTCPKGSHFIYEKGSFGTVDKTACYEGQLLTTRVAAPSEKDLQGALDLHAKPPTGSHYKAIGPLPVAPIGRSSAANVWLRIAFKIVKD